MVTTELGIRVGLDATVEPGMQQIDEGLVTQCKTQQ
jgi:hypothetical protein